MNSAGGDDPTKLNETISSSARLSPPPTIPDHELIRKIGAGAYGEVWIARNVLGAFRAVKIVYRQSFRDARPFEREFNGIQKYEPISRTHPGMVSILHVGRNEAGEYFYYIMEIADDLIREQAIDPADYTAKTLAAEIREHGEAPIEKALEISRMLASALEHLHSHGLIHRDIKPANIIFVKGSAKLADIGLVTEAEEPASFAGSPGYMPPDGPGAQGDVFSLGKVLYELVTGNRCDQFPEFPPGGPELNGIKQVLLKACESDSRKRYPSAKELRVALEQLNRSGPPPKRHPGSMALAAVAGILLIAVLLFSFSRRPQPTISKKGPVSSAPALDKRKLAVLPFKNISGGNSEDFEYFADGMTEQMNSKLSRVSGLTVKARNAVMKYKGSNSDLGVIARELGVGSILESSIQKEGDRVVITVTLIDAETLNYLWSDQFDQKLAEVLTVQIKVCERVAAALKVTLLPHEEATVRRRPTENFEAYDKYLRADYRFGAPEAVRERSIKFLEEAIQLDDQFAEAYATLSMAYGEKTYLANASDRSWEEKADDMVAKALRLNSDLPEAHFAKARTLFRPSTGFQFEEAIRELKLAIALRDNLDPAHLYLGVIYYHVGLLDESLKEYQKAHELNPENQLYNWEIACNYLMTGKYADAARLSENAGYDVGGFYRVVRARSLFHLGLTTEAKAQIEADLRRPDPKSGLPQRDTGGNLTAVRALFFAVESDSGRAHSMIAEALKLGEGFGHFHHSTHAIAAAYSCLNELESSLNWLRVTCTNGYPNLPWFKSDPFLANVRKDKRFDDLMSEMQPQFEHLKAVAATSVSR